MPHNGNAEADRWRVYTHSHVRGMDRVPEGESRIRSWDGGEMRSAEVLRTAISARVQTDGAHVLPRHLAQSRAPGIALEALLHGLTVPMLLVTTFSKILFMNAAAERLVRASDGLKSESDELRAVLPAETRLLRAVISGTAQISVIGGHSPCEMLRVSRPYGRPRLEVRISPLSFQGTGRSAGQPPIAAVFITDPQSRPVIDERALIQLYGLTPSETKVAVAVCGGLSGKEICRELAISYNTLKTHLKHIYAKTCTRHQSDLVRLLAAAPVFARCDD